LDAVGHQAPFGIWRRCAVRYHAHVGVMRFLASGAVRHFRAVQPFAPFGISRGSAFSRRSAVRHLAKQPAKRDEIRSAIVL
jgi:hypothetical protein